MREFDDANPFLLPMLVLGAVFVVCLIVGIIKGEKWPWIAIGTGLLYGVFYYYFFYEVKQIPRRIMNDVVKDYKNNH